MASKVPPPTAKSVGAYLSLRELESERGSRAGRGSDALPAGVEGGRSSAAWRPLLGW